MLSIFILKFKINLNFFLTKNNKINSCNKPANETAYDNIKAKEESKCFEISNAIIKTILSIIGAAAAAANLLYELSIAEKKDAKHIKNKKGKVILLKSTARFNFSNIFIKSWCY